MSKRVQRRRTAGSKLPEGAVYVGRPTKWGNPFSAKQAAEAGYGDGHKMAVYAFREWLRGNPDFVAGENLRRRQAILNDIRELRGADLACFCPLDRECHADVLLELSNA